MAARNEITLDEQVVKCLIVIYQQQFTLSIITTKLFTGALKQKKDDTADLQAVGHFIPYH